MFSFVAERGTQGHRVRAGSSHSHVFCSPDNGAFSDLLFSSAGCKLPPQSPSMDTSPCPSSPVFRTGSEPTLSPALVRRFSSDARAGEALRGSDSQLCPKPPPKPCKVPFLKVPPSPSPWLNSEANYCELNPAFAVGCDRGAKLPSQAQDSHEMLLTAKQNGASGPRNSGINYLILDGDDQVRPWDPLAVQMDEGQEDKTKFVPPLMETVSSFRPNDFESKLLPPENKPLETAMLKRAKELFTNHDARVIAQHMLSVDCKVSVLWLSTSVTFKGVCLAIPRPACWKRARQ